MSLISSSSDEIIYDPNGEGLESITLSFRLKDIRQEEGFDKKVYCVRFCEHIPSMWSYFAAVGSNRVSVYCIDESLDSSSDKIRCIYHVIDDDCDKGDPDNSEVFYSCTWASDDVGNPLVVASGKRGILKVVNLATHELGALKGHGDYVNELRTHPLDDGMVFSASRDLSLRLWNVRTMTMIAIFGGEKGHRDDIVSMDIHLLGNCMVSSSIDTSIKIWNLKDPKLVFNMENSDKYSEECRKLDVAYVQIPLFSTTALHTDYVDSVRWVGDSILSKSTNGRIVLWTPDSLRYKVRI